MLDLIGTITLVVNRNAFGVWCNIDWFMDGKFMGWNYCCISPELLKAATVRHDEVHWVRH